LPALAINASSEPRYVEADADAVETSCATDTPECEEFGLSAATSLSSTSG
jgi:hypothetical protein